MGGLGWPRAGDWLGPMRADDAAAYSARPVHVEMVCTGNICRSPMGEVILRAMLDEAGLTHVAVGSSGTGRWHVGEGADPPDGRGVAEAWVRRIGP